MEAKHTCGRQRQRSGSPMWSLQRVGSHPRRQMRARKRTREPLGFQRDRLQFSSKLITYIDSCRVLCSKGPPVYSKAPVQAAMRLTVRKSLKRVYQRAARARPASFVSISFHHFRCSFSFSLPTGNVQGDILTAQSPPPRQGGGYQVSSKLPSLYLCPI
jgi:hypothetical protein